MNWILVFIGGGLGSVARYGLSRITMINSLPSPWSTFVANVVASVLLALVWYSPLLKTDRPWVIPLVAVGFCGGLSTFSTYSMETFQLFRDGQWPYAVINIILSTLICVSAMYMAARSAMN